MQSLQPKKPDLLIVCATELEMAYFLKSCPCESKKNTKTQNKIFSGKLYINEKKHQTYDLLITGPGVFNTVHALTAYLERKTPLLILQTGIAGVFKQTGLHIGDIAIAKQERYIHTGVLSQEQNASLKALPFNLISNCALTKKGIYSFDQNLINFYYNLLLNKFSKKSLKKKVCVVKNDFITTSLLTSSFAQAQKRYFLFSCPVMESMEGAASAHVAMLYNIPILEIRAASNFTGEKDKSKWDIDKSARQLKKICELVLLKE